MSVFARKSHMERTRAESSVFVIATTVIALGALFAVTWVAGFGHVAARLRAVDPVWFAGALGAQARAYVGYVFAYPEVARIDQAGEISTRDPPPAATVRHRPTAPPVG